MFRSVDAKRLWSASGSLESEQCACGQWRGRWQPGHGGPSSQLRELSFILERMGGFFLPMWQAQFCDFSECVCVCV